MGKSAILPNAGNIGRLNYASQLISFAREYGGVMPNQADDNLRIASNIIKIVVNNLKEAS